MALVRLVDAAGRETSFQSKQTFLGLVPPYTPPATPTDLIVLTGSATKTVRVISFETQMAQTTAALQEYFFKKHTVANTAGTSTSDPVAPHDSNNAAASAVLKHYTANPTIDATAVTLQRTQFTVPATTAPRSIYEWLNWQAYSLLDQPLTLRGVAQELALNFNGAALPAGMVIAARVVWIEE